VLSLLQPRMQALMLLLLCCRSCVCLLNSVLLFCCLCFAVVQPLLQDLQGVLVCLLRLRVRGLLLLQLQLRGGHHAALPLQLPRQLLTILRQTGTSNPVLGAGRRMLHGVPCAAHTAHACAGSRRVT
jgi:hypothetical protein